jgi:hypothetical protein
MAVDHCFDGWHDPYQHRNTKDSACVSSLKGKHSRMMWPLYDGH